MTQSVFHDPAAPPPTARGCQIQWINYDANSRDATRCNKNGRSSSVPVPPIWGSTLHSSCRRIRLFNFRQSSHSVSLSLSALRHCQPADLSSPSVICCMLPDCYYYYDHCYYYFSRRRYEPRTKSRRTLLLTPSRMWCERTVCAWSRFSHSHSSRVRINYLPHTHTHYVMHFSQVSIASWALVTVRHFRSCSCA